MFGFQDKATISSYILKKWEFAVNNDYIDNTIDSTTGQSDLIIDCNKTKGGVDTVDKMCAAYNCARSSRRWPMVIYYSALNIAGINAFTIFQNNLKYSDNTS